MPSTRRTFLTAASGLALGTRLAAASAQGANDRIRIGVIGTGNRSGSEVTMKIDRQRLAGSTACAAARRPLPTSASVTSPRGRRTWPTLPCASSVE